MTKNNKVSVTALGFDRDMHAYPRRIEVEGITHSFIDAGLRTVVKSGEKITRIFTMTDGSRNYHLRSSGSEWTLLDVS